MNFNELHYRHLLYAICLNSLSLVKAGSVCFSAATSLARVDGADQNLAHEIIQQCSASLLNCYNHAWAFYKKFCEDIDNDDSPNEPSCYLISAGSNNATDLVNCIFNMLDKDEVKREHQQVLGVVLGFVVIGMFMAGSIIYRKRKGVSRLALNAQESGDRATEMTVLFDKTVSSPEGAEDGQSSLLGSMGA